MLIAFVIMRIFCGFLESALLNVGCILKCFFLIFFTVQTVSRLKHLQLTYPYRLKHLAELLAMDSCRYFQI